MQEIYFVSSKEAISFCDFFFSYNKKVDLHWQTDEAFGHSLKINNELGVESDCHAISKSMTDVFIKHRLAKMTKDLAATVYYYSNQDEMEQITELTWWIFAGKDEDSRKVRQRMDPEKKLEELLFANTHGEKVVHFDSLVQFRLQEFKNQLIQIIGLAIDEFKREEEHQAFISMLRDYISNKAANYRCVHVIQGNRFSFYKPDGNKFTNLELKKMMQTEPLYIVGLDVHEMNLAPLVAMAPKKIYVYGDYPSDPKTLTIINIFQEKVEFLSIQQFPFPNQLHR